MILEFSRSLSDPIRVRIVRCLLGGRLAVCEIADALELGMSSLSSHLQILRQGGIVETDRQHRWVHYSIAEEWASFVQSAFQQLDTESKNSVRARRDLHRLHQRLKMREEGCCCKPFGELDKKLTEIKLMNESISCDCGCGCCGSVCDCGCGCCGTK